jgi:hypothetical protein
MNIYLIQHSLKSGGTKDHFIGGTTNKTDRQDITEILLKLVLNTISLKKSNSICLLQSN